MNQETQNTTLPENPIQLASALTSKTIRYTNENESSVTEDRERTFKVISVEDVLISKASGNKYIKGYFARKTRTTKRTQGAKRASKETK